MGGGHEGRVRKRRNQLEGVTSVRGKGIERQVAAGGRRKLVELCAGGKQKEQLCININRLLVGGSDKKG